ncbi:MAG: hypothetical protein KAG14_04910, partial [Mycoplasmataceae bacterium]|nr:hypothetical protein [Mycoplasmataceae bacterium]
QRAEKYHFLLLDCEKYIDELHSEDDFFRIFHKKIEALLNITHLDSMASLDEITKWLLQHDFRLIVILENFNLVITNPNFNVIFYDSFRSWFSTNISIGCIITSPIELLDLAIPTELSGSPFFNIFSSFKLDPLTLTEAIKLLDSRLPEALKYNRGDIVNLIANIGFNPYELQLSGYLWVRHYEKTKKAEFNLSLVEIYNKLLPHYNEIYSNLKEDQINNIRGISSGDNNSNSIDRNLISNGWVTSDKKNIVAKQMEKYFRDRLSINCKKNKNTIKIIKLFLFNKLHFK